MKKIILKSLIVLGIIYISICGLLYFFQEKIIFHPSQLSTEYKFQFEQNFEELKIKAEDGVSLSGVLFKADSSKGLIFYLHGNGGCLDTWGTIAKTYTDLHYDLFILDYRGYGKSEGTISSQDQLFKDVKTAYDKLKTKYDENRIIVLGYSLGSGLATNLASTNNPKLLILQAPYFSIADLMQKDYPIIPTFILKYNIETNIYIQKCKMPIVIFHGDSDDMIYTNSSVKLKALAKPSDQLFILKGQGHNGMSDNPAYQQDLKKILEN